MPTLRNRRGHCYVKNLKKYSFMRYGTVNLIEEMESEPIPNPEQLRLNPRFSEIEWWNRRYQLIQELGRRTDLTNVRKDITLRNRARRASV